LQSGFNQWFLAINLYLIRDTQNYGCFIERICDARGHDRSERVYTQTRKSKRSIQLRSHLFKRGK